MPASGEGETHLPAVLRRKSSARSVKSKTPTKGSPMSDSKKMASVSDGMIHEKEKDKAIQASKQRILLKLRTLLPLKIPDGRTPSDRHRGANQSPIPKLPSLQEVIEEAQKEEVLPVRPNIKIRIITWNMHDSLPSGDLSELLGEIPEHFHHSFPNNSSPNSASPTPAITPESSTSRQRSSSKVSSAADGKIPILAYDSNHPYHIIAIGGQECPQMPYHEIMGRKGWTDVLEDWLSSGPLKPRPQSLKSNRASTSPRPAHSRNSSIADFPPRQNTYESREAAASIRSSLSVRSILPKRKEPESNYHDEREDRESLCSVHSDASEDSDDSESSERSLKKRRRKTPYVLVAKERLMGIYLAIFVFHECQHLVEGISRSKVTSGLFGGRVGNKGSVGISIKFANSRLLFMSTHLAAHQGGVAIRKANVEKIKQELSNDDFLQRTPTDPKDVKDKDITDRFDQVFLFGDLNFRLDISRLHADWLLKKKDYENALKFDQLKEILNQQDSCFRGFKEEPIRFPPTYKYDLLKLDRRKSSGKLSRHVRRAIEDGDDDISLLSSQTSADDGWERMEPVSAALPSQTTVPSETPERIDSEIPAAPAVQKARVKFLTLVRSRSALQLPLPQTDSDSKPKCIEAVAQPKLRASVDQARLSRGTSLRLSHSDVELPTKKALKMEDVADAVFDSSSKQRVQSWTDRILFKTNVTSQLGMPSDSHTTSSTTLPPLLSMPIPVSPLVTPSTAVPSQSSPLPEDFIDPSSTLLTARPFPTVQTSDDTQFILPRTTKRSQTVPVLAATSPTLSPQHFHSEPEVPKQSKGGMWRHFRMSQSHSLSKSSASEDESMVTSESKGESGEVKRRQLNRSHTVSGSISSHLSDPQPPSPRIDRSPTAQPAQLRKKGRMVSLELGPTTLPVSTPAQSATMPHNRPGPFSFTSFTNLRHFFMRRSNLINLTETTEPKEPEPLGPQKGEIECLLYDSVADLRKMEAYSDHRPVVGVYLVGV